MEKIKTKSFELAIYSKGNPDSPKLAIVVPGRLDTKDYIHITSLMDRLAERGYFALSFDPPGIWESPGDLGIYTTTNCIKAVNELIEFFGNKPCLLVGHSRGGTITMLVGPENENVTKFVSIFSYYGAPENPEESRVVNNAVVSYRDFPPGDVEGKERKKFELPLNYFEDGKNYNALSNLKDCKKPKLFFFATKDQFIDEEEVREVYDFSAGPKEIHKIDSVHDYRYSPEAMKEVNDLIEKFLDKYDD